MSEDNKKLLQRWFDEVWNQGRSETIDELLARDGIVHGLSDDPQKPVIGPAAFHGFHDQFREAFPDMEIVIEDMIAEGDKVVARCSVRGKHQGDSLGFAATQSPVEFTGIAIVRVRDGQFVEAWNNFDFMKMYRQLSALSHFA
jgi:steroid delta-isomerase-like uncharacterized protein